MEFAMDDALIRPRNCGECAYWEKLREHEGLCRRHAPRAASQAEAIAHWPQTQPQQWCGEGIVAAARPGSTCAACLYWRHSEGGLDPTNRGDMLKAWWARAGICLRYAPRPVSEPGPRAFWKATGEGDGCGEGEPRTA
jgi:hypothetical protein